MRLDTPQTKHPTCHHCQTPLQAQKIVKKDLGAQALGLIIFLLGLALLFIFPIGTIAGIILMVISARLGYSKKDGWKCPTCGYQFTRE